MKKQTICLILALTVMSSHQFLNAINNNPVKWLIEPQYEYAESFSEDLAVVWKDGKAGYINKKGEIVIKNQFDFATSFSEGLAAAGFGEYSEYGFSGEIGYIDKQGKFVIKPRSLRNAEKFKDNVALVYLTGGMTGAYQFIDKKGEILFSGVQYAGTYSESMSEGLTWFVEEGKYGYINNEGNVVIKPRFENALPFKNGMALTFSDGKCSYINAKGESVITLESTYAGNFSEGIAMCKSGDKCGYINKKGEFVIKPQYDDGWPFLDGLAFVKLNNKFSLITMSGKEIEIKTQINEVGTGFCEGLAMIGKGQIEKGVFTGKSGYIDKDGGLIIEEQFDDSCSFREGVAAVKKDNKWGFIINPLSAQTQEKSSENLGLYVGNIKSITNTELIVGGSNIGEKVSMGDKLCLYSNDKIIILRSTFPMMTVTNCDIISGNRKDIKPGMKVYKYSAIKR